MLNDSEIDLNLQHYVGERTDVLKKVQLEIKNYLRTAAITDSQRAIYSAIYNALTYYQMISDLSISGESANPTFLEQTIAQINDDFSYLSEKYYSGDIENPVISMKARVKSPISAMDKILDKISEYVKTGRDLSKLNESLRDFIGIRIIVNPPPEIKALGKQAELDYCYTIFDDLMKYHGIVRQLHGEPDIDDYTFIPVPTEHDPLKLAKIKSRPDKEGYEFDPEEEGVYIPVSRPGFLEEYDEYFKDYIKWPKLKLYQRVHACVNPKFHEHEEIPSKLPTYMIPSQSNCPAIEYQICTLDQEEYAEHGKAAHTEYKPRTFHRLRIPLIISLDSQLNKLRLNRLDESMEMFYGYSFKDLFFIDYQDFLKTFNTQDRNDVLAGIKAVSYDEENEEYFLEETFKPILFAKERGPYFIKELLETATPEELQRFYSANGILDNSIKTKSQDRAAGKVKLFSLATSETRSGIKTAKVNKVYRDKNPSKNKTIKPIIYIKRVESPAPDKAEIDDNHEEH